MFDLGLAGKVALITGGSDGLGRAAAARFAQEGCKVAICARREDHLMRARDAIADETGGEIMARRADVTRAADLEAFVRAAVERFGGIDIAVNNAGRSAAAGFEAVDDDAWREDIDLKLMACVRLCRLAVPIMRARGGGAIINAAIVAGKAPPAGALPTSVTRAAGLNLTKSLANEYAGDGIRVNAICIGLIASAQWEPPGRGALRRIGAESPPRARRQGGGVRGSVRVSRVGARGVYRRRRDQSRRRHVAGRVTPAIPGATRPSRRAGAPR